MDSLLDFAALGSVETGAGFEISGNGLLHAALPFMRQSLDRKPIIYSVYYRRSDGSFLQLIHCRNNTLIKDIHKAPEGT